MSKFLVLCDFLNPYKMLVSRKVAHTFKPPNCARNYQVTILGAGSEIGQTLSLLLRVQPSITKLVIHDNLDLLPGVLMDVAHVPASTAVVGFTGDQTLDRALKDADLVIAAGGMVKKPGITKKSWFCGNTCFIRSIAPIISKCNPMPFVGIATEPLNIVVPMMAEIMRNQGNFDAKKLFGISGVDALRAQCLYAAENCLDPGQCFVPVIGGHSAKTLVPLLSQCTPAIEIHEKVMHEFTMKLRKCDETVVKAKRGWSPTLSISYSILLFVRSILEVLDGRQSKVAAFVENNDFGTSYFSGLVTVDKNGAGEMKRYTNLSQYEVHLLERSIGQLRKDVSKGRKILELA